METATALPDIERHLFMKPTLKASWQRATVAAVLASLRQEVRPLTQAEKQGLPLFGFDKPEGHRDNVQQFPTRFVILELDMPGAWKKEIAVGCAFTQHRAQGMVDVLFWQFRSNRALPYYWMYVTHSTCGLRFVLRTDRPVRNEDHYLQVVKQFLRLLYRYTNGRINPDYFDIRVNQGWFVPTFTEYLDRRERQMQTAPYAAPIRKALPRHGTSLRRPDPGEERILLAVRFTERNFSYTRGQHNNYVHHLACNGNRLGLAQEFVRNWINTHYDLDEREITAAVRSAYRRNTSEHGRLLRH